MALSIAAESIKRFAAARYALAVSAVAVATGLRLAFDPVLGQYSPYLPFVAVVIAVARLGGRGPALVCTALSSLSVWYLFLDPRYSFRIERPDAIASLALFTLIAAAISFLEPSGGAIPRYAAGKWLRQLDPEQVRGSMAKRTAMFAVAVLAIGILIAWLWQGFERATAAGRWVEHTYQVLNAADSVRLSLERAETSARGYLLTGDDAYIAAYFSAIAAERQARATLRHLTADNRTQQARLDEYDCLAPGRLAILSQAIEARQQQGEAAIAGLNRTYRPQDPKLVDRLLSVLDAVNGEEHRLLRSRSAATAAADARTRWILGLGGGSLLLLLVVAGATIERHMHERAQVERVLARQVRLIDLSHDAIVTADGNRLITGWNSGAQQMYGWSEGEAIGRPFDERLRASANSSFAEVDRTLALEGRWNGELDRTASDGRLIVVDSCQVLQRDAESRPSGYLVIDRDITERKKAEDAVRESQAKLEAALASMTDAVFISDPEGRFVHFNDAFATFHKFRGKEECLKTLSEYPRILDISFPDGTPVPLEMWAVPCALRGETVTSAERLLHRKDTGETWVGSYSFGPILDPAGAIVGAVVVARDITDRKQAEDQIRRLNAELEQRVRERTAQLEASNKELEAFAYSVSHDLRAPLRGIDGWSLALMEDYGPALDSRAREYLGRVRSETQRMGQLIDNLLVLSRVTRSQMHFDTVNLSQIAEAVSTRLREAHPERCLEFAIRPELTVFGDARLLEVALTNLLGNAVKFTSPRPRAWIEFEPAESDNGTAFVVRDNGVGFDMAYAGALFGAFQRLHRDDEFPGTGIGLATVQRIIHRHGGEVWADAEPGRGAAFYFTIGGEK